MQKFTCISYGDSDNQVNKAHQGGIKSQRLMMSEVNVLFFSLYSILGLMSNVLLQVRKQSWFQDFKDTVSLKSLFAYNNKLIPPDPDFFSAGISFESDDK